MQIRNKSMEPEFPSTFSITNCQNLDSFLVKSGDTCQVLELLRHLVCDYNQVTGTHQSRQLQGIFCFCFHIIFLLEKDVLKNLCVSMVGWLELHHLLSFDMPFSYLNMTTY